MSGKIASGHKSKSPSPHAALSGFGCTHVTKIAQNTPPTMERTTSSDGPTRVITGVICSEEI
ncbi:MAG: hypothetical protein QM775_30270 [Pirellulales bacterium]